MLFSKKKHFLNESYLIFVIELTNLKYVRVLFRNVFFFENFRKFVVEFFFDLNISKFKTKNQTTTNFSTILSTTTIYFRFDNRDRKNSKILKHITRIFSLIENQKK